MTRKAVVIGAGITGGLVARELLLAGWQVDVVEARHVGAGSSSRTAAGIRQQMADGLAHPDLDPESVARHLIAVWNGLQSQWLTDPAFDLADEIVQAWRRLTGQPAMEAKRALEAVIDRI